MQMTDLDRLELLADFKPGEQNNLKSINYLDLRQKLNCEVQRQFRLTLNHFPTFDIKEFSTLVEARAEIIMLHQEGAYTKREADPIHSLINESTGKVITGTKEELKRMIRLKTYGALTSVVNGNRPTVKGWKLVK